MTIDKKYVDQFISVTSKAAIASSHLVGKKDKIAADKAAVDAMRSELNKIEMSGQIVIGEGELDEAPMLYVNEKVGNLNGEEFDIAVDPLEGTNFTAKNLPNALSVLAVARKNNMLNSPDVYMEKIAIGPNLPKDIIDLDLSVEKNILFLSQSMNIKPDKITACVLNRPRHDHIVKSLNKLNVNINFIEDGDVSGVLSVADKKSPIDIYIGTGGGPEGVLAAAGLKCLDCQMQTRLVFQNKHEEERAKEMGIKNTAKKYYIDDMIKGDVIFCATGVTDGDIIKGIKDQGEFFKAETFVLHHSSKTNKIFKNLVKK